MNDSLDCASDKGVYLQWVFLLMTPIYLGLVYYKMVSGVDTPALINISIIMAIFYVPLQIMVTESKLTVDIKAIANDTNIRAYFIPVCALIALLTLIGMMDLFHVGHRTNDATKLLSLIAYGIWWYVSEKLFALSQYDNYTIKIKLGFWLVFILSLLAIEFMPALPGKFDWTYAIGFVLNIIAFVVVGAMMVPRIGFQMLKRIVKALTGDALNSGLYNSPSSIQQKHDSGYDVDAVIRPFVALFLLYSMVFIPFIGWLSSVANSIDPFWTAIWLTLIMTGISSLGAHFQLKLLFSRFLDDQEKVQRISNVALFGFYLVILVNIGLINTIHDNENRIKETQQSIERLNNQLQQSKPDQN